MNIVRVITAGLLAIVVTGGLFILMNALIQMNAKAPEEPEQLKIADVTMPETEIETRYETAKPDKPPEPDVPPPDMPEPDFETPDLNPDALNMSAPKGNTQVKVGGIGGFGGDGEYLPIVKVQPVYPRRALQRGIEGYVIVEFTVTKSGAVRDPVVVEAEPANIFNKAAMKAALKFKYKPRVVDGEPIEVPGVRNKITFAIAK
ncbi:energy transducer TonB [Marinibactrum halimedae]|uniref:Protein TonB n=1 Tax=Marinibactrum halimedae TaxID=1444977 RepID=A0AA37T4C0_9GAMM|nr:energy transducer TonB [Marinibactrum halimedae]MCD9458777.1 energy transducer TonB [Marinibactrum halimedae]GLS25336.1 protein TonB [Marinibactrum halimedae]